MCRTALGNVEFYHFISAEIKSNMFIFLHGGEAVIIDPHYQSSALNLLQKNKIKKTFILLTHEHPDHTYGLPYLKDFLDCTIVCHTQADLFISAKENNRPLLITFILAQQDEMFGSHLVKDFMETYREYAYHADITFDTEYTFHWNDIIFHFISTPGHSPGSCCILVNDELIVTGDSLLSGYPVITRFPGGSTKDYQEKTLPYLKSLNKELIVLPGHGKICKLSEIL